MGRRRGRAQRGPDEPSQRRGQSGDPGPRGRARRMARRLVRRDEAGRGRGRVHPGPDRRNVPPRVGQGLSPLVRVSGQMPELHKTKVLLLGDGAVGKTSLIRRFVVDQFGDDYITTIGTKVSKRELSIEDGGVTHLVAMTL